MSKKFSKYLLISGFVFFFVYLSLNVVLNFTALRSGLSRTIEKKHDVTVSLGYLFFDWKFRPVLQSLTLKKDQKNTDSTSIVKLMDLTLHLKWTGILQSSSGGVSNYINALNIDSAEVFVSSGSVQTNTNFEGLSLPDIPVSIQEWSVRMDGRNKELFTASGRDLTYSTSSRKISAQLTSYQRQPADGELYLQKSPDGWEGNSRLDRISFSDNFWPLESNRWSGTVGFQNDKDSGTLTVSLAGSPGKVGGLQLPTINLETTVFLTTSEINVQEFSFFSDSVNSNFSGKILPSNNRMDIDGNFSLQFTERFESLLTGFSRNKIQILKTNPIEGTLALRGPILDPQVSGEMSVSESSLSLSVNGESTVIDVSNFGGELKDDQLSVKSGLIKNNSGEFSVESGLLQFKDGRLTSSLTGEVRAESGEQSLINQMLNEPPEFLKSSRVRLKTNLSSSIGPENLSAVLAIRDGQVKLPAGAFRNLKFLFSYSTGPEAKNSFNGSFVDPDSNSWNISGSFGGPLTIKSKPNRIDKLIKFTDYTDTVIQSIKLNGFEFNGAFKSWDDPSSFEYKLSTTEQADVKLNGRTMDAKGEIEGTTSIVNVKSFRFGNSEDYLDLQGTINPKYPLKKSTIKLRAMPGNFSPGFLLEGYLPEFSGNLTGDLLVEGPVIDPLIEGEVSIEQLDYHFLQFSKITSNMRKSSDGLRLRNIKGRMNRGEISGKVDVSDSNFKTDIAIDSALLRSFLPGGSWVQRNSSAQFNAVLNLEGNIYEPATLNGSFNGNFSHLVLSRFPEIEDLEKIARDEVLEDPVVIKPFDFNFPVNDGVVKISGINLKSKGINLKINGNIKMNGLLDLDMKLTLIGDTLRGFLQDVVGDVYRSVGLLENKKRLDIPLEVTGTIQNPEMTVRHAEVNKNFRQNLIKNLFSEPLGDPVNELLDEIFFVD